MNFVFGSQSGPVKLCDLLDRSFNLQFTPNDRYGAHMFLIDTSTSMDDFRHWSPNKASRLAYAVSAAATIIKRLPDGSDYVVRCFDGGSYTIVDWETKHYGFSRSQFMDRCRKGIEQCRQPGSALFGAVERACIRLRDRYFQRGRYNIMNLYVISDGEARDQGALGQAVPWIARAPFPLRALLVDIDTSSTSRAGLKALSYDEAKRKLNHVTYVSVALPNGHSVANDILVTTQVAGGLHTHYANASSSTPNPHHNNTPPTNHYGGLNAALNNLHITSPVHGRKLAVLVGIEYRGQGKRCLGDGPRHDLEMVNRLLKEVYGFTDDNIRILSEDQPRERQPTRQNIISYCKWLVQNQKNGDRLFFYYTGHGTDDIDELGEEKEGRMQSICPLDNHRNGNISDKELNEILVRPLELGVFLYGFFDCCHSGTIMNLAWNAKFNKNGEFNKWVREYPNKLNHKLGPNGGTVIQISAALKDQVGFQGQVGSRMPDQGGSRYQCGYATRAFVKALKDNIAKGKKLTYSELFASMRAFLAHHSDKAQEPILSSSTDSIDLNRHFFTLTFEK